MGRPERSLDPARGPAERFAAELRRLRECAGRPGYRELSRRAHYSVATLAEAAGGRSFPSLAVTLAFANACGGDRQDWEARWLSVAEELATAGTATEGEDHLAPYRGLQTFEVGDAEWFFGRRRLVDQLVDRLSRESFLVVLGPSGSGKSSLLRAGLVPALGRGAITDAQHRLVLLITPGEHPVEALAAGLATITRGSARSLRDDLLADPHSIRLVIRQALPATSKAACVVLIVDQFEEIFTKCRNAAEKACFIDCLLAASDGAGGRGKVVVAVRADSYARCATYPVLVPALRDRQVLVDALSDDELREMVTGPAARAGLKVERALVEVIVEEARGEPGALALVSHALMEIWRRRKADTLTLAAYRGAGGIQDGIAQIAERVFEGLDSEQQQIAQSVFLRLTALGDDIADTRRRVRTAELLGCAGSAAVTAVLERLVAARLVTVGESDIQLAHEAIIRHWPRLRGWLSNNRDMLRAHRQLVESATEWEQHGKNDEMLYRGIRLAAWDTFDLTRLNTLERAFLIHSRRQARERTARGRWARLTMTGVVSAVTAGSVLAIVAVVQASRDADGRALLWFAGRTSD